MFIRPFLKDFLEFFGTMPTLWKTELTNHLYYEHPSIEIRSRFAARPCRGMLQGLRSKATCHSGAEIQGTKYRNGVLLLLESY